MTALQFGIGQMTWLFNAIIITVYRTLTNTVGPLLLQTPCGPHKVRYQVVLYASLCIGGTVDCVLIQVVSLFWMSLVERFHSITMSLFPVYPGCLEDMTIHIHIQYVIVRVNPKVASLVDGEKVVQVSSTISQSVQTTCQRVVCFYIAHSSSGRFQNRFRIIHTK